MLDIHQFGELLRKKGFTFFTGIPCSLLKDLINYSMNNFRYIAATNEGEAVAIAAGAHLAGMKSCVLMQNSGLTNALNPLTSLNYCFRIPVLGFVSWRGEPGTRDEPEHELMGKIMEPLLSVCKIPYAILSKNIDEAEKQMETADSFYSRNLPYFFIVKRNTFSGEPIKKHLITCKYEREIIDYTDSIMDETLPTRLEVLEEIKHHKNDSTILLASTGKGGRELFEIEDTKNNLYMVGSMGCVSSIGLGIALNNPDIHVIAIDGDGALLMRMGSLATNGFYRPKNLLHILLDNGCHDSTGGQETVSENVNFTKIAAESGYNRSAASNNLNTIRTIIKDWKKNPILTFLHVEIKKGSKNNLGRPTVLPYEVRERIMKFIAAVNR